MKKSKKIFRIIWIVGVYLLLTTILYLVVLYKVEWEHKDLNTYLYFYNCNGDLCSSNVSQSKYYNKILCEEDNCPFINDIIDNNVVLEKNEKMWIYNYVTGDVINNSYDEYRYLTNDLFVVTDNLSKQGLLQLDGTVLVLPKYEYISKYKDEKVVYLKDGFYGVDSIDGQNLVDSQFEDIVLIDEKKYAGFVDGEYHIYAYNNSTESLGTYRYIETFNDVIFVIYNNKIDILTLDFDSTLLMKINTFYSYTTEKERDSLSLRVDNGFIYFNVYTSEDDYTTYKYNIESKKLV